MTSGVGSVEARKDDENVRIYDQFVLEKSMFLSFKFPKSIDLVP